MNSYLVGNQWEEELEVCPMLAPALSHSSATTTLSKQQTL